MPKVSVIIPAYNPGLYLRETLESVHKQTFADWELVLVNDGSTEDLSWVQGEYPKITVLEQRNSGVSVARNNGILRTTGEYLAFMDQDDVWLPEKLARQVAALIQTPDAAVSYCDLQLIDGQGALIGSPETSSPSEPGHSIVELDPSSAEPGDPRSPIHRSLAHFSSRFIVPSSVMIRRSALATSGLLDPFIPFSGDYDLLIKLGSRHKVIRVPCPDVLYRKHSNNFSDQYEVGRREVEALISRYKAYAKSRGDSHLLKCARPLLERPPHVYAAQAYDCARRSLAKREILDFVAHLKNALLFSPVFVLKSLSSWMIKKLEVTTKFPSSSTSKTAP